MAMKKPILICALALSAGAFCTSCRQTEKTEGVTAQITAAQMMGRDATKYYVRLNPNDSNSIRAFAAHYHDVRKAYREAGRQDLVQAFDSTFRHTLLRTAGRDVTDPENP